MMKYYILVDRKPVKVGRSEWFEDRDNRHVARTKVGEVLVSTFFNGFDTGFVSRPAMFETLVFGGALDREADRHATWDEAERGHEQMVARVRRSEFKHER